MNGVPPIGAVLAGKYRVDRVLGKGGMGVVVSAWHMILHQQVALKFLTGEALQDATAVERFIREARAAVRLQSEHVARVIDVSVLENGAPYMVMELLEGGDLAHYIHEHKRLAVPSAVDIVLEAIDAIAEAHSLGIVHRDVKPSNLFIALRSDGSTTVKVLDFGISKVSFGPEGAEAASLTSTAAFVGSPLYMSPEQFLSAKKVDSRTDVWALGVILYESLTGEVPFTGESFGEVFAATLQREARPIRAVRPDVPPQLEQVVARCMRKERGERFSNVAELAQALAPFGSGRAQKCVERACTVLMRTSGSGTVRSPDGAERSGAYAAAATSLATSDTAIAPQQLPMQQTHGAWGTSGSGTIDGVRKRSGVVVALVAVGVALLVVVPAATILVVKVVRGGSNASETAATADTSVTAPASASIAVPPLPSSTDTSAAAPESASAAATADAATASASANKHGTTRPAGTSATNGGRATTHAGTGSHGAAGTPPTTTGGAADPGIFGRR